MHPLCVVPCLEEGVLSLTGGKHQPIMGKFVHITSVVALLG